MIEVRRIGAEDWAIWRELRLRALADAPEAFGTTLEEVLGRDTEEHWRAGVTAPMVPFLVEADGAPAGMGRLLLDDAGEVTELISVWIASEARGRGAGRALLDAAVEHHAAHLADTRLLLAVVETNAPARRLYERGGFVVIGPNPEDDAELLMERLRGGGAQDR